MKRFLLSFITILTLSIVIVSCEKGGSINDPLVEPGPTVAHPDSTEITVRTPATVTATSIKMVGDMKGDFPIGWQPGDNTEGSSLQIPQVSAGLYRRQVAISWFVKPDFQFKFVRASAWGTEENNIPPALQNAGGNRFSTKSNIRGKKVEFTVVGFN